MKKLFVITKKCEQIKNKDLTNGAVSRLIAWKIFFPEIEFLDYSENSLNILNNNNDSFALVLDMCGEKTYFIIKYWNKFRKFRPGCFLQDSQSRYFFTKFRFESSFEKKIYAIINFGRGVIKECIVNSIFNSVGYISSADKFLFKNAKHVELLYPLINYGEKNIEINFSIKTIRFLGNFQYEPNNGGLNKILSSKKFVSICSNRSIKIVLSGKGAQDFVKKQTPEVRKIINEDISGEFNSIYDLRCDNQIFICPVFYGAGIKNKIIEAKMLNCFTLAWEGVRSEFMYDLNSVGYFSDVDDMSCYIDFICEYLSVRHDQASSFFEISVKYQMHNFVQNTGL